MDIKLTVRVQILLYLLLTIFPILAMIYQNFWFFIPALSAALILIKPQILKPFFKNSGYDMKDKGPQFNKIYSPVSLSETGKVLIIKASQYPGYSYQKENLFLGVGDIVTHHNSQRVRILKFEIKKQITEHHYLDCDVFYYYLPLEYQWGDKIEKVSTEEASCWTNHPVNLTNISKIENCETTQNFKKKWWDAENKRRAELPRYFVKINYPKSEYKVGDIVECFNSQYCYDEQKFIFCESYPEIFERVTINLANAAKTGIFDE